MCSFCDEELSLPGIVTVAHSVDWPVDSGSFMREQYLPLQAQATELAAAVMAEEEEFLLLQAQVRP